MADGVGNAIQDAFGQVIGSKYEQITDLAADTATAPLTERASGRLVTLQSMDANPKPEKGLFHLTAVDSFGVR